MSMNDTRIKSANLHGEIARHPERRGWFFGQFVEAGDLFNDSRVEIKWGVHAKGTVFPEVKASGNAKSISILIDGHVRIHFPDDGTTVELARRGDAVCWAPGVFHSSEVLEDSIVMTIRTPSLEGDALVR